MHGRAMHVDLFTHLKSGYIELNESAGIQRKMASLSVFTSPW